MNFLKKLMIIFIIGFFIGSSVVPIISGNQKIITTNTDNSDDFIVFDRPPIPPEKPIDGVYYRTSSSYTTYWNVHENIWNVFEPIIKIIWWGLIPRGSTTGPQGTPEDMDFSIEFFDDDEDPSNIPPSQKIDSFEV